MMLDQLRPLTLSIDSTGTPNRAAIRESVSPATIVYRPPSCAEATGATVAPGASLSTWPGKISDFQPRPLRARTDAVDRLWRPAIAATVSPACTVYVVPAAAAVAAARLPATSWRIVTRDPTSASRAASGSPRP